jgi:hypothetical protein
VEEDEGENIMEEVNALVEEELVIKEDDVGVEIEEDEGVDEMDEVGVDALVEE